MRVNISTNAGWVYLIILALEVRCSLHEERRSGAGENQSHEHTVGSEAILKSGQCMYVCSTLRVVTHKEKRQGEIKKRATFTCPPKCGYAVQKCGVQIPKTEFFR